MSESTTTEKRTRSQLTLPDNILQLSQHSPLKHARIALRNNSYNLELGPHTNSEKMTKIDDEIPSTSQTPNALSSTKRSASPFWDEYTSRSNISSEYRELKRIRRDFDVESDIPFKIAPHLNSSNHTRSHSQPNIELGWKAKQSLVASPLSRKHSSSLNKRGSTSIVPQAKGRAQSVPLFPSVPSVPHLDLRNPPSSPTRSRSRSPSKGLDPDVKIVFGANTAPELALSGRSSMVISSVGPKDISFSLTVRPSTSLSIEDSVHSSTWKVLVETNSVLPSTPSPPERSSSTYLWSPLTPLPETPYLPKSIPSGEGQYNGIGRDSELDQNSKEQETTIGRNPNKSTYAETETNRESPLARPASSNIIDVFSDTVVSLASLSAGANLTSEENLTKQSSQTSSLVESSSSETMKLPVGAQGNAFTVLMDHARLKSHEDASKRTSKEKGIHKKVTLSSVATSSTLRPTNPKGKRETRNKELEIQNKSKLSVKAKMRPKQTARTKPVPVPTPTYQDECEGNIPTSLGLPLLGTPVGDLPPASFPASPTRSTPKDSLNNAPKSSPRAIIHPSPLSSGHLQVPPEIVEHEVSETSVLVDANGETSNTIAFPGDPPQSQMSPNPIRATKVTTASTSKLPRAKRAPPTAIVGNTARRVSSRLKDKDAKMTNPIVRKSVITQQVVGSKKIDPKPLPLGSNVGHDTTTSMSSLSDLTSDGVSDNLLLPGSPMKISSPGKSRPVAQEIFSIQPGFSIGSKPPPPKTPSRPQIKSKSESPSPSKLSRSTSMFSMRPRALSRTFTSHDSHSTQSSLSTLSNALEKLRMPPPARPSTSMGFNRDSSKLEDSSSPPMQDADKPPTTSESGIITRQNTVANPRTVRGNSVGQSAKVQMIEPGHKPILNRASGTSRLQSGTGPILRGIGSGNTHGSRPAFGTAVNPFRVAGRAGALHKVSRKTTLPSVMASPVKGSRVPGSTSSDVDEKDSFHDNPDDHDQGASNQVISSATTEEREASKVEQHFDTQRNLASRRASLASQSLSQSLSSLPISGDRAAGVSSADPLITPLPQNGVKNVSSSYPTTDLTSGRAFDGEIVPKNEDGVIEGNSKILSESLAMFLRDCTIFVDVRTDDGDEAGSLFVEMLESVGARILTRVGQTCTHIVYKNGLASTSTKYRLLREPKPLVVGIAWVVECIEQRRRVDESKYAIDLNSINIAGVNKRRRSMLPKAIVYKVEDMNMDDNNNNVGDQSLDGSSSSMIMDDGLTPLEKARRRKGVL